MCSNLERRTHSNRGRRATVFNDVNVHVVIYILNFLYRMYIEHVHTVKSIWWRTWFTVLNVFQLWFFHFVFSNYLPEVVIKGFSTRGRGSAAALKPPTDEANRIRAGVLVQIPVFHVGDHKPIKPSRSRFNVVGDCSSLSGDISEPHHVIKPW